MNTKREIDVTRVRPLDRRVIYTTCTELDLILRTGPFLIILERADRRSVECITCTCGRRPGLAP